MKRHISTKDMTYIAIGIAAMISGGFLILYFAKVFPIPGVKYIMMSPYLSMTLYIVLDRIRSKLGILIMGTVLGLIMTLINIYMGIAIALTSVLSYVTALGVSERQTRIKISSSLFSGYTGLTALLVAKYLIGGVFEKVTIPWIIISACLCLFAGVLGVVLGDRLIRRIELQ